MANKRSIRRAVRPIPVVLALVFLISNLPAYATDLVANRSELIQNLLPTVVNITVRKQVASSTGSQDATVADVAPGSDAARSGITSGDIILRVGRGVAASPDAVWKAISSQRTEKRECTIMLVLEKHPRAPGAKWVVLRLQEPAG
jgi:hypothetical protein